MTESRVKNHKKGFQYRHPALNTVANERGDWQYQKDRPDCNICGLPARYHHKESDGSVKYWRNQCTTCHKNRGQSKYKYRIYKKDHCEICGFIPVHPGQLDVDHIDSNKNNYEENNLQTICANCHRLKTVMSGDHNGKRYIPSHR